MSPPGRPKGLIAQCAGVRSTKVIQSARRAVPEGLIAQCAGVRSTEVGA